MSKQDDVKVIPGLVLKPGDRVLLGTNADWSGEECKARLDALRSRFPDVEFTIINDVTGLAVYDAE